MKIDFFLLLLNSIKFRFVNIKHLEALMFRLVETFETIKIRKRAHVRKTVLNSEVHETLSVLFIFI